MTDPPEPTLTLQFYVPPEQEAGAYAHAFSIWATAYDFTLDFAVVQPPEPSDPDDPESPPIVPARVVARVRVPPTIVFELLRAINARMEAYEAEWGEIRGPQRRREEGGES
jgi:hypothetical protein